MKLHILIGIVVLSLSTVDQLFAQDPQIVFDPVSFEQFIVQTEALIDQVDGQVTLVRQGFEEAEREIRKIASLPYNIYNGIRSRIEENIAQVNNIINDIEDFAYDIEGTVINAGDLFTTDRDYSAWFDYSLPPEVRRRIVEREFEAVQDFYLVLQQHVEDAFNAQQNLEDLQGETSTTISNLLREIQDSESTVQHMQSANLIAGESYALLSQMATDINNIRIMIAQSLNRNADQFDLNLPDNVDGLNCNVLNFADVECPPISGDDRSVDKIVHDILTNGFDPHDYDSFVEQNAWMYEIE